VSIWESPKFRDLGRVMAREIVTTFFLFPLVWESQKDRKLYENSYKAIYQQGHTNAKNKKYKNSQRQ
jgi:hypothetical protein